MAPQPITAVARLLDSWLTEDHRSVLATYEEPLLDEAADGVLAALHHSSRQNPGLRQLIESVRLFLDFARNKGYADHDLPLAEYGTAPFRAIPISQTKDPFDDTPSSDAPTGDILMTLLLARSWRVRKHIVAAYPDLLLPGGQLYDTLRKAVRSSGNEVEHQVYSELVAVLDKGHSVGLDQAFPMTLPPPIQFHTKRRQPAFLTTSEHCVIRVQQYLYTPTWHGRMSVLHASSQILLSDEACENIRMLEERHADDPSRVQRFVIARTQLESSIRLGIDEAFRTPLPPTHVPVLDVFGNLERVRQSDEQGVRDKRLAEASILRQSVYTTDRDLAPLLWSHLNSLLAYSLTDFPNPNIHPYLSEEAILCGYNALDAAEIHRSGNMRVNALIALGIAYRLRIRGERTSNRELAIEHLSGALLSARRAQVPDVIAHAAAELTDAYHMPSLGSSSANKAIIQDLCREVVALPRDEVNVVHWAHAKIALSRNIRSSLTWPLNFGSWDEAVGHLEDVVAVVTPMAQPNAWVHAHLALAACFASKANNDSQADLDAASTHLRTALLVGSRERDPAQWAAIQFDLGALAALRARSDPRWRRQAQEHLEAALQIFNDGYPHQRLAVFRTIGHLHFENREWEGCRKVLATVAALGEAIEGATFGQVGRLLEIGEMTHEYERYAYCLCRLGRTQDALRELDAGKTRLLRSEVDATYQDATGGSRWMPESDSDWLDIVPAGGALVLPLVTSQGSAVIIVTTATGKPEFSVVDLDKFDTSDLVAMLHGEHNSGGWLLAYFRWQRAAGAASAEWPGELVKVCKELWLHVMAPVDERLQILGIERDAPLVIFPSWGLSLFPLGAAARIVDGKPDYFLDHYSISYAPSLGVLRAAKQKLYAQGQSRINLLAVVDPTGDLPHAAAEWQAIRDIVPTATGLHGSNASAEAVAGNIAGRTHLHFACHGNYDWRESEKSGLTLANGERLQLSEIAGLPLDGVRMVVLSACETGIVETDWAPHEFIGVHGAFLSAGVPTAISSLWSVADEATQVLMERFYQSHIGDGLPVASALRAAQQHVRSTQGYAHPYFWAGFFCSGA